MGSFYEQKPVTAMPGEGYLVVPSLPGIFADLPFILPYKTGKSNLGPQKAARLPKNYFVV
jgi:hypothetical protein